MNTAVDALVGGAGLGVVPGSPDEPLSRCYWRFGTSSKAPRATACAMKSAALAAAAASGS
jgi:hypothetical protein